MLSGVATDSDLRLLGYYSWDRDQEWLAAGSQLPTKLKGLEAICPPHLTVEKVASVHGVPCGQRRCRLRAGESSGIVRR